MLRNRGTKNHPFQRRTRYPQTVGRDTLTFFKHASGRETASVGKMSEDRAGGTTVKKRTTKKKTVARKASKANRPVAPAGYVEVLTDMKRLIADSRHRALASVNRELVGLYWHIGRVIVQQQERANWGDSVVDQLSTDLRATFPDVKGLSLPNIWKMRQFYRSCREIDTWLSGQPLSKVGALRRPLERNEKLSTVSREFAGTMPTPTILSTLSRELASPKLVEVISQVSWSQHTEIQAATDDPAEHYFYMAMSARERWSVRELRRQINADLFTRYISVKSHPEKCLPDEAESGDLLPFKDHYLLEFLGLEDEHSELQLRKSILANLRDFFLEFAHEGETGRRVLKADGLARSHLGRHEALSPIHEFGRQFAQLNCVGGIAPTSRSRTGNLRRQLWTPRFSCG